MLEMVVLASGRGSNFIAIQEAIAAGDVPGEIRAVISDKPAAPVLDRARDLGIPALAIDAKAYDNRAAYDAALLEAILEVGCDIVVLAGYMKIIGRDFLQALDRPVVNIHPSLLPAFPGLDAQGQAVAYGVRVSGCTVHFVDESLDGGPIIAQRVVPVYADDTADSLSARILVQEHDLYPAVLKAIAEDRVRCEGRKVTVEEEMGGIQ